MYYLRKKYKNKNFPSKRYTTTDYFFKVYIDKAYVNYYDADAGNELATQNASAKPDEVADMEMTLINTIKDSVHAQVSLGIWLMRSLSQLTVMLSFTEYWQSLH